MRVVLNLILSKTLISKSYDGVIKRESNWGLPQGSVLSPLLIKLMLSPFSLEIHPNAQTLLYADDAVVFASHNDLSILSHYINR